MTNDDKQKFAEIMWGVADVFGGEISQSGLRVRFAALYEYRIEDIEAAGAYLLRYRKAKFPAIPTIAEFVDIIDEHSGPATQAEEQADWVLKKLRDHNPHQAAIFEYDDEITEDLMTTRWPFYAWSSRILEKDIPWWRKDFVAAYTKIAERERYRSIRESIGKIDYKGLKRLEKP